MKKVLAAMSGGVDSSVIAYLLKKEGCFVSGASLKLHEDFSDENGGKLCGSGKDIEDAEKICDFLGIEHYVFNFEDEFNKKVIDYFVNSYLDGKTPNPCVICNRYMKFEHIVNEAKLRNFDCIATGHYAQIEYNALTDRYMLKKATDQSKDQTYFLYNLSQEQLSMCIFPLGKYLKSEVRKIAENAGLLTAKKPDSQDICFVKNGDYVDYIEKYIGKKLKPGKFISTDGSILGENRGQAAYTIGQRRGIGISLGYPAYVLGKSAENNTVTLGTIENLYSKRFIIENYNPVSENIFNSSRSLEVKIRYRHGAQPAKVEFLDNRTVSVEFFEAQKSITPGQAAVIYDGDYVIGGGEISL